MLDLSKKYKITRPVLPVRNITVESLCAGGYKVSGENVSSGRKFSYQVALDGTYAWNPDYNIVEDVPPGPDLSHLKNGDEVTIRVKFYKHSSVSGHVVVSALSDHTSSMRVPDKDVAEFPPAPPPPLGERDRAMNKETGCVGTILAVSGDNLWVHMDGRPGPLTYQRDQLKHAA